MANTPLPAMILLFLHDCTKDGDPELFIYYAAGKNSISSTGYDAVDIFKYKNGKLVKIENYNVGSCNHMGFGPTKKGIGSQYFNQGCESWGDAIYKNGKFVWGDGYEHCEAIFEGDEETEDGVRPERVNIPELYTHKDFGVYLWNAEYTE